MPPYLPGDRGSARLSSRSTWLTTQSLSKPVSGSTSLLIGKLTGNFVIFACGRRFLRPDAASNQCLTTEFPTQLNREFSGTYQGRISAIQGMWSSNMIASDPTAQQALRQGD